MISTTSEDNISAELNNGKNNIKGTLIAYKGIGLYTLITVVTSNDHIFKYLI